MRHSRKPARRIASGYRSWSCGRRNELDRCGAGDGGVRRRRQHGVARRRGQLPLAGRRVGQRERLMRARRSRALRLKGRRWPCGPVGRRMRKAQVPEIPAGAARLARDRRLDLRQSVVRAAGIGQGSAEIDEHLRVAGTELDGALVGGQRLGMPTPEEADGRERGVLVGIVRPGDDRLLCPRLSLCLRRRCRRVPCPSIDEVLDLRRAGIGVRAAIGRVECDGSAEGFDRLARLLHTVGLEPDGARQEVAWASRSSVGIRRA